MLVTYRYKFEFTWRSELFEFPWCPESLSLARFARSTSSSIELSESQTDFKGRYVMILDLSSEDRPSSLNDELPVFMSLDGLGGCSSDMLDWETNLRACGR